MKFQCALVVATLSLAIPVSQAAVVYQCVTEKHVIHISDAEGGAFRYQSWNRPRAISEKPDMDLTSKVVEVVQGSSYWKFNTGRTEFQVSDQWRRAKDGERPSGAQGATGDLWVRINGQLKLHLYCR